MIGMNDLRGHSRATDLRWVQISREVVAKAVFRGTLIESMIRLFWCSRAGSVLPQWI
jgi:hypothetical protein